MHGGLQKADNSSIHIKKTTYTVVNTIDNRENGVLHIRDL